jgi:hypothetical protein
MMREATERAADGREMMKRTKAFLAGGEIEADR